MPLYDQTQNISKKIGCFCVIIIVILYACQQVYSDLSGLDYSYN